MKKYLFFFENELIEVLVISPKSRNLRAKTGLLEEINCYITVYFFDRAGFGSTLTNGYLNNQNIQQLQSARSPASEGVRSSYLSARIKNLLPAKI